MRANSLGASTWRARPGNHLPGQPPLTAPAQSLPPRDTEQFPQEEKHNDTCQACLARRVPMWTQRPRQQGKGSHLF